MIYFPHCNPVEMGPTHFIIHRTDSNILFSNIERTHTCSFIGNRTQTPYFWLRTIEQRTSNSELRTYVDRPITTGCAEKTDTTTVL